MNLAMQINNTDIQHAFEAFKSGGVILIPSDVCWEVACDATNAEALEKLNKLMNIGSGSVTVLVDVSGRIPSYVSDVPDIAWDLIDLSDTSLNLILPNAKNLAKNAVKDNGSAEFRVVNAEFCQRLINRLGKPIAAFPACRRPCSIDSIDSKIKSGVDYIVPDNYFTPISNKLPGIIAIGKNGEVKVIRE